VEVVVPAGRDGAAKPAEVDAGLVAGDVPVAGEGRVAGALVLAGAGAVADDGTEAGGGAGLGYTPTLTGLSTHPLRNALAFRT